MPAPASTGFSERAAPHDPNAEVSVLGAMIMDPQTIPHVQAILRPEDFYAERHQWLYDAVIATARRGPVDLTTLQSHLRSQAITGTDRALLEEIGGLTYLSSLINQVPTTANAEAYARIVEQAAALRRYQAIGRQMVDDGFAGGDPALLIAKAEAQMQKLQMGRQGTQELEDLSGIGQWIAEYVEQPDDDLLPTGLDDLDDVLEIRRGQVHGLMGPPKMGKSTVARQAALNQAEDGLHVLFISLEENRVQQRLNFLALRAGLPKEPIRRKWLKPGHKDWSLVQDAAKRLDGLPIKFDYTPSQNIAMICAKIRYYALTWGLDVVYVDTGQAVDEERRKDERGDERLIRMVREVEAACKVANCAAVIVIQGKQEILTADSYWLTPMHVSDARGMVQAFTSVIGVMRPEKITNPKSKIYYAGAKLFAQDDRWRNVMALFKVADRQGEENLIIPVYCDMKSGQIGNLAHESWPWKAPDQYRVSGSDRRIRRKREPRAERKAVVDQW